MNILFFDSRPYDKLFFNKFLPQFPDIKIDFIEPDLSIQTAILAKGYESICVFVNAELDKNVLEILSQVGVKLILMRCAGYNNLDIKSAKHLKIKVMCVPGYSPQAIAEHAIALALTSCRKIHKAYVKVRENDFSLQNLMGVNLYGKTAGIIGTGKIGSAMAKICHGFGMNVIAYDTYQNPNLHFVSYTSLESLFKNSDLISLHCPLTKDTYHMINKNTINQMKDGVIFVNTSRGALVKTVDLINGIRAKKFFSVGLDVYEEEKNLVFKNKSDDILEHSVTARLLSFPNVVITSHQGFFTYEALESIAKSTLNNATSYLNNTDNDNKIV